MGNRTSITRAELCMYDITGPILHPSLGNWQVQREKGVDKMVVKKKHQESLHMWLEKQKCLFQNKPVFTLLTSHSAKAHKG